MTLQPQTAQAVLHHIADDPVRREKLGSGGDILLADFDILFQVGENFFLCLGVVILIQPADDLHVVHKVFFRNLDQPRQYRLANQKRFREQEFHVFRVLRKQLWKNIRQRIALADQHIPEKLLRLILVLELFTGIHIKSQIILDKAEVLQDIRLNAAAGAGQYAEPMREIIVQLHEAECHEPVKPRVGKFLDDILIAFETDLTDNFPPPSVQGSRIGIGVALNIGKIAALFCFAEIIVTVDAESLKGNLDLLFQIILGPYGICL